MGHVHLFAATLAAIVVAAPASAVTVLDDDFDTEAGGGNAIPVASLINFNITGTVDIVAPANGFGIVVPSSVIDLDGTPGPGAITTKTSYAFGAGDLVTLTLVVGGAQRGSVSDSLFAGLIFGSDTAFTDRSGTGLFGGPSGSVGTFASTFFANVSVPGIAPFSTSTISFRPVNAGTIGLTIGSSSADNVGPLLDRVRLDIAAVPEPATWTMLIAGFGLVGGAARRRRTVAG